MVHKEPEPGAFSPSGRSHAIHAVVPVASAKKRQAMRADGQAFVDRAGTVLEKRTVLRGTARLSVRLMRIICKRRRFEECHSLVQDTDVPGRPDVLGDCIGQPEQIVGASRAQPAARRLVPPMLHVAFDELMSGGPQQVLAPKVWPRERERHHVLQLIAEAERAARLVVTGAGPEAAAHVLIQQPPVHQHIKRIIRRPNADTIETAIP